MKKIEFDGDYVQFEKVKKKYDDYDIVYHRKPNVGIGYHEITIFKQPKDISNFDLAFAIDGFFWDIYRYGNTLQCWYD